MTTATRLGVLAVAGSLVFSGCTAAESPADGGGSSAPAPAEAGVDPVDGTLTLGAVRSGGPSLEGLRRAQDAGARLAVREVNRAGGVLDEKVVLLDHPKQQRLTEEVTAHLDSRADVLLGGLTAAQTRRIADTVQDAGATLISATAAGARLPTGGALFRTTPSEVLLATTLVDRLARAEPESVAVLVRADRTGRSFLRTLRPLLSRAELAPETVLEFEPGAEGFARLAGRVADAEPDAVVVAGLGESRRLLADLNGAETGPRQVDHYLLDGNTTDYGEGARAALPESGALPRATGFRTGQEWPPGFADRLAEVAPELTDHAYVAEAYDAVVVAALAAAAAGTDEGSVVAEHVVEVTRDGARCTAVAECLELIDQGHDVDYDGVSGPLDLSDDGSPTLGTVGVYAYDGQNRPQPVGWVGGRL